MITLPVIFTILLVHWFADFVLQTDKQAKGKSKNWSDLTDHTIRYSFVWVAVGLLYTCPFWNDIPGDAYYGFALKWSIVFPIITFIAHTVTDYFTSRLNARLYADGKTHLFFVSIGFDQILHYVQLFLTYQLLK